jgi:hypothetical protein
VEEELTELAPWEVVAVEQVLLEPRLLVALAMLFQLMHRLQVRAMVELTLGEDNLTTLVTPQVAVEARESTLVPRIPLLLLESLTRVVAEVPRMFTTSRELGRGHLEDQDSL